MNVTIHTFAWKAHRYWMLSCDLKPGKSKARVHTTVQLSGSAAVNFPSRRNGSSLPTADSAFQHFIAVFRQLHKCSFVCKYTSFWETLWGFCLSHFTTAVWSPHVGAQPVLPVLQLLHPCHGGQSVSLPRSLTTALTEPGLCSPSDPFCACCFSNAPPV